MQMGEMVAFTTEYKQRAKSMSEVIQLRVDAYYGPLLEVWRASEAHARTTSTNTQNRYIPTK